MSLGSLGKASINFNMLSICLFLVQRFGKFGLTDVVYRDASGCLLKVYLAFSLIRIWLTLIGIGGYGIWHSWPFFGLFGTVGMRLFLKRNYGTKIKFLTLLNCVACWANAKWPTDFPSKLDLYRLPHAMNKQKTSKQRPKKER